MSRAININYLSREDWEREVEKVRPLMFNETNDVTSAITSTYNLIPKYIAYFENDKLVVSFLAFTVGSSIKLPIHFFYSAIWISPNFSDTKYCQIFLNFLRGLKRDFKSINVRLPHHIVDIRPFIWTGFEVENRFTYVKNLISLNYSKDVSKNISKLSELEFVFKEERLSTHILDLNLELFYDLSHYPSFKIQQIKTLIKKLSVTPYLTCFSCYLRNDLVASHILFIDEKNKMVYTVLRNKIIGRSINSIHTILYHHLFLHFKNKGYLHIDLLGADMERISLFKSRFKANLFAVNILRYSKYQSMISNLIRYSKIKLLNILVRFKF